MRIPRHCERREKLLIFLTFGARVKGELVLKVLHVSDAER